MSIKLSIITICYNEKDVENTCLSIMSQTWRDFEWIVIDGGSDSWCTDILEKYREHMAYYVSEKDAGRYDAMNEGISHAKGEYLLFMNAGDLLYDDTVLHDIFAENKYSADIIYGNEKLVYRDGTYKVFAGERDFTQKVFWIVYYNLRHQASFIKKALFDAYGVYDTKYRSASDFEKFLTFIYLKKCSVQFIDRFISIFKQFDGISSEVYEIGRQEVYEINGLAFKIDSATLQRKFEIARGISNTLTLLIRPRAKRTIIRNNIRTFIFRCFVDFF